MTSLHISHQQRRNTSFDKTPPPLSKTPAQPCTTPRLTVQRHQHLRRRPDILYGRVGVAIQQYQPCPEATKLDQPTPRFTPVHQSKYRENGSNGYVRGKRHQAIDCCLMVHIYSLCPQGLSSKTPFLLASTSIFYIGSTISQGSQSSQYKSLPEDGPPALFLDRHPSMTACTMDLFEALHTFIARQYCWSRPLVELTALHRVWSR